MNVDRSIDREHILFCIGVIANLVPYLILRRPLPDLSAQPFDNIWIAEYTFAIVDGAPVWVSPDPWFRYIPQSIALAIGSVLFEIGEFDALATNAYYTVLCEAILVPVLLYMLVQTTYSRREALVALFFTALVQALTLPLITILPTGGMVISWYFTTHWQYAFAMPWILLSFIAIVRATKHANEHERMTVAANWDLSKRRVYLSLAGVFLGLAGSIQFVQGGLAAFLIAVFFLRKQQLTALVHVAVASIGVALPNLYIFFQWPERWLRQMFDKANPSQHRFGTLSGLPTSDAPAKYVLIVGIVVAILLWVIYNGYIHQTERATDRWEPIAATFLRSWLLTITLIATAWILSGTIWYVQHALYIWKFAAFGAAGVSITQRFDLDTTSL